MNHTINHAINRNSLVIRRERPDERRAVEELVRESFWNVSRPGCLEHYVLHCGTIPILCRSSTSSWKKTER